MSLKPGVLQSRLLSKLQSSRGEWVSMRDLIDAVYGPEGDGGADDAHGCIRVAMCKLRASGMTIERSNVYRLPPR
jgi:hypothetical protein